LEGYCTDGQKVLLQLHFSIILIEKSFFPSDNDFVAIIELPEGKHEYKFCIDGRWEYDLTEVGLIFAFNVVAKKNPCHE
jgi:hypothetical protein